ncbi:MAG TPA: PKD domain-containing protein, partial [Thermoplasmatales archaeon]|nr:PKD domain-containing protein [Thermoplasmatales archaeon]
MVGIFMKMERYIMNIIFGAMVIIAVMLLLLTTGNAQGANVVYVDDDASSNWYDETHVHTIQEGIVNVTEGGTVYVWNGNYHENVNVNKTVSIIGNGSAYCNVIADVNVNISSVFYVTANYVNISGFNISGATIFSSGIQLYQVENCNISNNILFGNFYGILLYMANNNTLSDIYIFNNSISGAYLLYSDNNTISYNTISSNNWTGVTFYYSNNNTIFNNTISGSLLSGIYLMYSTNTSIYNSTMLANGIFIEGNLLKYWNTHTIVNNTVNSKVLYYWRDMSGGTVPSDAGQVILANCTNIVVENQNLSNENIGALAGFVSHCTIANNTASNNGVGGIWVYQSNSSTIINNTVVGTSSKSLTGIYLFYSANITVTDNNISNNIRGIYLYSSNDSLFLNNILNNNVYGIFLNSISINNTISGGNISGNDNGTYLSSYNTLSGVNITNNTHYGVYFSSYGVNNTLSSSIISGNEYGIYMSSHNCNNTIIGNTINDNTNSGIWAPSYSDYNTLANNTINDNGNDGIFFQLSSHNQIINNTVNNNTRGIHLQHDSYDNVAGNTANLNRWGISLLFSSNNTIANNTLSNNSIDGIYLGSSSNNTFMNNIITDNTYGIYLESSSGNTIYNNYFDNTNNAHDDGNNIWNISKIAGVNIVNGPYFGGNYWNDYGGADNDADSLGDTLLPYNSSGGIANGGDYHPLVPNVFYVDDDFDSSAIGWHICKWDNIQDAIDNASNGYTIYIWNGTYTENVTVDKTVSIIGNSSAVCTVQTNDNTTSVFTVTADYVNINGLNISGANASSGVKINAVEHCNISNNILWRNHYGIYLYSSSNNTITNCNAYNNSRGINLYYSSDNTITNFNAYNNSKYGIHLSYSSKNNIIANCNVYSNSYGIYMFSYPPDSIADNIIVNCSIYNNYNDGIYVCSYSYEYSSSTTIENCSVYNNSGHGIFFDESSVNNIIGCSIYNNSQYGIWLESSNNNILNCTVYNNDVGICLSSNNNITDCNVYNDVIGIDLSSSNNNITDCSIYNNSQDGIWVGSSNVIIGCSIYNNVDYGIWIGGSSNVIIGCSIYNNSYGIIVQGNNNLVYNNYFNNTHNAYDDGNNIWNTTKTAGRNIVNGPYLGGNYWSDYGGTDTDGDKIGDTLLPYNSHGYIKYGGDYLPLIINHPPVTPYNPSPSNGSTSVSTTTDLSWQCFDPDGDDVTYDVYFGTSNPPPKVSSNQTSTTYDPGTLSYSKTYYWRIVTWDDTGLKTIGGIWHFTTKSQTSGGAPPPPPPPMNQPPVADADGPYSGYVGYVVSFDGSDSYDTDGSITNYTWDFGDGSTGYGVNPTHIYTSAGTYTVTLTVKDNLGSTGTNTTTATIIEKPAEGKEPIADANGPYHGLTNQTIVFDGSASYDPDGSITSYTWNFGDGSTGYGVNPTHAYTVAGNYTVTLTVTDNDGLTNTTTTLAIIKQDTDGDGWSDQEEEQYGSDPENATSVPKDTDNDHIPDVADNDDDNDGLTDEMEENLGTDPENETDFTEVTIETTTDYLVDT